MESRVEQQDRYDEFARLEHAIASNKRYLQELNQGADLIKYHEVYADLIKVQERLLKEISRFIL
jgi:hypothetical protein